MTSNKLTTKEAAAKVGCPVITIQQAILRGRLPATRFGWQRRIDPADLAKWDRERKSKKSEGRRQKKG